MQRSRTRTAFLYAFGLLALGIDLLVILDLIQFFAKTDPETVVPMVLAIPLFAFPIFISLFFFVLRNTQKTSPERRVFLAVVVFPYLVAGGFLLRDLL